MKYQELLNIIEWGTFWDRMLELYPLDGDDDEAKLHNQYRGIFNRCCVSEPASTNMRIVLTTIHPTVEDLKYDINEKSYIDVSGKDGTISCNGDEEFYGIEFLPWNEWLDMEIDSNSLIEYPLVDIAVHCMWEMSFISDCEGDIEDIISELNDTIDSIKKLESTIDN